MNKYLAGMRVNKCLNTLILIGIAVSLMSCNSANTKIDASTKIPIVKSSPQVNWVSEWLIGYPCRPPCWEGITPGSTNVYEAMELLNRNSIVSTVQTTTVELLPDNGYLTWNWFDGTEGGQADYHALSTDKIIDLIDPRYPTRFKLDDVIKSYGQPDYVLAAAYRNPNQSVAYDLTIIYDSLGIVLFDSSPGKPVLSLNIPLRVNFFTPTKEGLAIAMGGSADHPEWLSPWQGIKDFEYYCRDLQNGKLCRGEP